MTPEEKFNQEVWFVLNKIKKYSFYSKHGQDVEYRVYSPPNLSAEGMLFPVEEMKIISKLVEWNAIKIKKPGNRLETAEVGLSGALQRFIAVMYLEILKPKFDELYNLYEESSSKTQDEQQKTTERPVTRIEITSMPALKIKDFEEKVVLQKPKNKRIQLPKLPPELQWEEVEIRFLNEQEVIIKARNETFQTTYEAMGFQDEKRKMPNKQWQFLKGLSEVGGEISWKSPRATPKGKKQKQLLAETLKAYFQLTDDPFYLYKEEKAYKIKIKLIPEGDFAKPIRKDQPEDLDDEESEDFKEQNSGINNE